MEKVKIIVVVIMVSLLIGSLSTALCAEADKIPMQGQSRQDGDTQAKDEFLLVAVEPELVPDDLAAIIRPGAKGSTLTLDDLPNETVLLTIKSLESDGKVSYLVASAGIKNKTYLITEDYMKYVSVIYQGRVVRVGVGLRARASVRTLDSKVDINGLLPVGISASLNKIKGNLQMEVIGISSRDITNALPLPTTLSQDSVVNAIQALAFIKSRIYDKGDMSSGTTTQPTKIRAQIIAKEYKEVKEIEPGTFTLK